MGYNSANYVNTVYQAMSLAFADRDFYYGDPAFAPKSPIKGLLSKAYAKERAELILENNNPRINPGDPYPFQNGINPYKEQIKNYSDTYLKYNEETDEKVNDSFLEEYQWDHLHRSCR